MRLSYLFIVAAIVALIYGLALALLPDQFLSIYGAKTDATGILATRLFGVTLIGISLVQWFARNAGESEARSAIIIGAVAFDGLGFIVTLLGQIANVLNTLGWINVLIYLLLTLGFAYFLFMRTTTRDIA